MSSSFRDRRGFLENEKSIEEKHKTPEKSKRTNSYSEPRDYFNATLLQSVFVAIGSESSSLLGLLYCRRTPAIFFFKFWPETKN